MSREIKACPFCGGEAEYHYRKNNTGYEGFLCFDTEHWISCHGDCGASTAMHEYEQDALDMWNRRAGEGE